MSAIVAHHLAGGELVRGSQFITVTLLLISAAAVATSSELEGPKLAAVILFAQFFGHVLLSTENQDSFTMALSHTAMAGILYLAITKFESAFTWISSTFSLIVLIFLQFKKELSEHRVQCSTFIHSCNNLYASIQYWTTSPPLVVKGQ
jgi:uncharacterized membrane protein YhhN